HHVCGPHRRDLRRFGTRPGQASLRASADGRPAADRRQSRPPPDIAARRRMGARGGAWGMNESPASLLRVADLTVSFGAGDLRFDAVKSVSFAVAPGEAFGVVGESGSGKSTALGAIAGFVGSWTGRIELGGHAVSQQRNLAQRRLVQMVFQDPYGSLH